MVFDPRIEISAALKGSCSTKPVSRDTVLARVKSGKHKKAITVELEKMSQNSEIMSCAITRNGKTILTYWETGMPAKQPYSQGRSLPKRSTASVSL